MTKLLNKIPRGNVFQVISEEMSCGYWTNKSIFYNSTFYKFSNSKSCPGKRPKSKFSGQCFNASKICDNK